MYHTSKCLPKLLKKFASGCPTIQINMCSFFYSWFSLEVADSSFLGVVIQILSIINFFIPLCWLGWTCTESIATSNQHTHSGEEKGSRSDIPDNIATPSHALSHASHFHGIETGDGNFYAARAWSLMSLHIVPPWLMCQVWLMCTKALSLTQWSTKWVGLEPKAKRPKSI